MSKETKIKVGDRFGNITVIDDNQGHKTEPNAHKRKLFLVKCDCGIQFKTRIDYLLRGDCTKCRECRYSKMRVVSIGDIFSKLEVIRFEKTLTGKIQKLKAVCRCVCGKEIFTRPEQLKNGITKHCGCQQSPLWKGIGLISKTLFGRIERNAKVRSIYFNITIEDLRELYQKQDGKCALTRLPIKLGKKSNDINDASLDRIDSSKPYIKENIQWVHKDINLMKMDFSEERLFELCKLIVKTKNL